MKRFLPSIVLGAALSIPSASVAKDIQQFIINGQSLSTGHQSWPVLSTGNIPGNYMLGQEVWTRGGAGYSNHNYWGGNDWDIHPLIGTMSHIFAEENNNLRSGGAIAECPILGAVNHMQLGYLKGNDILATSVGVSGATVEELSKEATSKDYYTHFTEALAKSKEATAAVGYDNLTCPVIFWMQGEHNYFSMGTDTQTGKPKGGLHPGEENCTDRATYKDYFMTLMHNMQNDVVSAYGQAEAPVIITYQAGAQYVRDYVTVGMAQLQAANENDDIIMAGPVYPYPDRGGHLDANGYRMYGEMLAKAYYKKLKGESTVAMQPKKIVRENDGKTLRISYYVPVGPMVFDTNYVPKIKNYGFNVYTSGYGASKTPASITIEGDDVVMTFAEPLDGKITVTYADNYSVIESPVQGLNDLRGHGNLRDSDPYQSLLSYIDLDGKDEDGNYIYSRNASETRLRPDFEPKDTDGSDLYGKPYPLYNFSVAFCYTLGKNVSELEILDENNKPIKLEGQNPGNLAKVYVDAENGNDDNVGSEELPVASLQTALNMVNPNYRQGVIYVKGKVDVPDELTMEGQAIEIVGIGDDAVLDGLDGNPLLDVVNKYVTLRNLTCTHFKGSVVKLGGGFFVAEDCEFVDNTTSLEKDANGGALSFTNTYDAKVTRCQFINNKAYRGSAIYAYNTKGFVVNNSIFDSNVSDVIDGLTGVEPRGTVFLYGTSLDADNCVFVNNIAAKNQSSTFDVRGGSGDMHFTLTNCDILDNRCEKDHGGVLVCETSSPYEFNFVNCNIIGNHAQACGSFAWWLDNWNEASEKQTLNIYNCTITGNHTNGNTYHSCLLLWNSRIKTNIVNTIFEGNTAGGSKEYTDIHAGEFTVGKESNINVLNSVVGKFYAIKNSDNVELGSAPTLNEKSQINVSPNNAAAGEANYAGLLERDEDGLRMFASLDSKGIGMGDDKLLADKYGITTDRLGNVRKNNSIGSIEFDDEVTGIQMVSADDSRLKVALDGGVLRVVSSLYGNGVVMEIYTIDGRRISSFDMPESEINVEASQLGEGIRVLRVVSPTSARSAIFKI